MPDKSIATCRICKRRLPVANFVYIEHQNRRDRICGECRKDRPHYRIDKTRTWDPCIDCGGPSSRYATRCKPCARAEYSRQYRESLPGLGRDGFCECGCGQKTALAKDTNLENGNVCGQPKRFRPGHQSRKYPQTYVVEDRGYKTPCWVWQGSLDKLGYGQTWDGERTHRRKYLEKYGAIPDGLVLDHLCRVTSCCNPDHLEPVTDAINSQRGLVAKITPLEVTQIRRLYAMGGRTQQSIADEFGLTQANVSDIILHKIWKNVA